MGREVVKLKVVAKRDLDAAIERKRKHAANQQDSIRNTRQKSQALNETHESHDVRPVPTCTSFTARPTNETGEHASDAAIQYIAEPSIQGSSNYNRPSTPLGSPTWSLSHQLYSDAPIWSSDSYNLNHGEEVVGQAPLWPPADFFAGDTETVFSFRDLPLGITSSSGISQMQATGSRTTHSLEQGRVSIQSMLGNFGPASSLADTAYTHS